MEFIPNRAQSHSDIHREIQIQHDSTMNSASSIQELYMQTEQLRTMLAAKQAELDRYTAQYGPHRPDPQSVAESTRTKLLQQTHKLRQCRNENKLLRIQNQELGDSLEVARKELEEVDHLRCNICMVAFKNVMVPCGHSACRPCLELWLGQGQGCPWCNRRFEGVDVRDIYLGSSDEIQNTRKDDDDETEVISLSSDSE